MIWIIALILALTGEPFASVIACMIGLLMGAK